MRHLYHCALGIVEPRGAWFPPSNWYVRLISVNHGASGVSEPTALNPPESDALDLIHCMIMNANDCQLSLLDFDFTPRTPPGRLPIAMSFVWYSGIVFVAVLTAALVRRASCRSPPHLQLRERRTRYYSSPIAPTACLKSTSRDTRFASEISLGRHSLCILSDAQRRTPARLRRGEF